MGEVLIKKIMSRFKRKPDIEIEGEYLHRWFLIPRNRVFNIYLHKFMASDPDRGLHDHPWYSASVLLKGELIEHNFKCIKHIPRFFPVFRSAKFAHRLELVRGPVWTIFITGPKFRTWGFYTPDGWKNWRVVAKNVSEGKSF